MTMTTNSEKLLLEDGGVGLTHLVYLTQEGTLSNTCIGTGTCMSYGDIQVCVDDADDAQTKWWRCCSRKLNMNKTNGVKLSHAKGISKRISEVSFCVDYKMICIFHICVSLSHNFGVIPCSTTVINI